MYKEVTNFIIERKNLLEFLSSKLLEKTILFSNEFKILITTHILGQGSDYNELSIEC